MDTNDRSIPEMVAERKALARQQSEINQRLEVLDSQLFAKLEKALDAFGLKTPIRAIPTTSQFSRSPSLQMPDLPLPTPRPPPPPPPAPRKSSPRQGEIGHMIQKHVTTYLKEAGKPLKTGKIFELLRNEGVDIPGKDPRNNLSAHLSRSIFFARKRTGWWFAEEEKEEPPVGGS